MQQRAQMSLSLLAAARKQPRQGEGSAAAGTMCFLPTMGPVAVRAARAKVGGHGPLMKWVPQAGPYPTSQQLGCLREVWCHRNTCCARTLLWALRSQQPRLPRTASDTGTPCSLQTRHMDRGMWGRGNGKGIPSQAQSCPGWCRKLNVNLPRPWEIRAHWRHQWSRVMLGEGFLTVPPFTGSPNTCKMNFFYSTTTLVGS